MKGAARPHLNLIINRQLDANANKKIKSPILRTVNGSRLPKWTFCYNFTKTKSFISLDSRFVDLQNAEERATLAWP